MRNMSGEMWPKTANRGSHTVWGVRPASPRSQTRIPHGVWMFVDFPKHCIHIIVVGLSQSYLNDPYEIKFTRVFFREWCITTAESGGVERTCSLWIWPQRIQASTRFGAQNFAIHVWKTGKQERNYSGCPPDQNLNWRSTRLIDLIKMI